jgi:hypothetical protein
VKLREPAWRAVLEVVREVVEMTRQDCRSHMKGNMVLREGGRILGEDECKDEKWDGRCVVVVGDYCNFGSLALQ